MITVRDLAEMVMAWRQIVPGAEEIGFAFFCDGIGIPVGARGVLDHVEILFSYHGPLLVKEELTKDLFADAQQDRWMLFRIVGPRVEKTLARMVAARREQGK